jgi:acetyl-CoA carboxylase biotin carboxyl carrier protein
MNLKELRELIDLVQNSQVVELEIEKSGVRVRIKKGAPSRETVRPVPTAGPGPVAQGTPARETAPPPVREREGLVVVTAPVVGTFYRAPSPDAPPYVEAGVVVKKGQVLCVIEAMKLMNEIEAECEGKILEILVENGQSVEFGEPLFYIDTTSPSS